MINFSQFKKKVLTSGEPYLSITDAGITFNKICLQKLDLAERVLLFVNEASKEIFITPSNDSDSIHFVSSKRKDASYVRWNNNDFRDELYQWASSSNFEISQETGAKVIGTFIPEDNGILFDFKTARPLRKISDPDLPF